MVTDRISSNCKTCKAAIPVISVFSKICRSLFTKGLPLLVFAISCPAIPGAATFPELPAGVRPLSYEELQDILPSLDTADFIEVMEEGRSVEGRTLYLVHLNRDPQPDDLRLFLLGQQHGDEHAGKDALIVLMKHIARTPELLPTGIDLWIMPMVNPDGAAENRRRNGNGADLNRDHTLLAQPETQAVHRLSRRIGPHITIDCHEFGRDSQSYREKGWLEWPLIMMDTANNPFLHPEIYRTGKWFCEQLTKPLNSRGINYTRYYVGNTPPGGELRYSTLEVDDARNGLAAYGGLGFIIESGVYYDREDPHANLHKRVDAYLRIFQEVITNQELHHRARSAFESSKSTRLPRWIPNNYFWGNHGPVMDTVLVTELPRETTKEIPTANFMHHRVVKQSVPTPLGYLIPRKYAGRFLPWLKRSVVPYRTLSGAMEFTVEPCRFERLEEEWDPIYSWYDGRQVVTRKSQVEYNSSRGDLIIPVDDYGSHRTILLLEPTMLYGLFQFEEFRDMAVPGEELPVYRITDSSRNAEILHTP